MQYSIKKAAVIGAGVMGAGIAAVIAGSGIPVCLLDIVPMDLSDDEKAKGVSKSDRTHRNRFAQTGLNRISDKKSGDLFASEMAGYITVGNLEDDLEKLEDCDWIIEVIPENLELKQQLLDKILPHIMTGTILSTNTSGIPVQKIAEKMPKDIQRQFLGTHFFNPPRYMRLLEIIPGANTDPELVKFMEDFGERVLGKGIVMAKDTPNFIGNRIGCCGSAPTMSLMGQYGFDIETVDYLLGPLIGRPKSAVFKTLDIVGLDILYHVCANLVDALEDEEEKEIFRLPDFYAEMVREGNLGNKTGGGFYKKAKDEKGKKQTLVWDVELKEYRPVGKPKIPFIEEIKKEPLKARLNALVYSEEYAGRFVWETLKHLLLYSARRVPEISDCYEEIDKAMKWGYNWEVGPFEIWDMIGFERSCGKMEEEGEELPGWVQERLNEKRGFYDREPGVDTFDTVYPVIRRESESVILDMGDGVVGFEVHTKGNCITAGLMDSICETLDFVEEDPSVKGMVLLNSADHFLTGADVKGLFTNLNPPNFEEIGMSIDRFQRTSMRLKYSKKPVVAAIHGMVLGGGMEFSIHCPRIIAHADTYMGLVEVGVGIIPGGGGIKELLLRAMEQVRIFEFPDCNPVIRRLWENISTAAVSKNAFHARGMGYLRQTDKIVMQIDRLAQAAKEEVLLMDREGFRQAIPQKVKVTGTTGRAYLEQIINSMKDGQFISPYDAVIAGEVAFAISGGEVPKGAELTEWELLALEKQGIVNLCANEKTFERVKGMLETGRALRN